MQPDKLVVAPKGFRWRTMTGEILTIAQMDTTHIFNSMKMVFNHLAEAHDGRPIWFNHKYKDYRIWSYRNPKKMSFLVCLFISEIERRGDLPQRFHEPYRQILNQIVGIKEITDAA